MFVITVSVLSLFFVMQALVMSLLEYGLGLLILSNAQLNKLERVMGCTRDTPVTVMRYLFDMPSIRSEHKYA